jgi:hypothetical protein
MIKAISLFMLIVILLSYLSLAHFYLLNYLMMFEQIKYDFLNSLFYYMVKLLILH